MTAGSFDIRKTIRVQSIPIQMGAFIFESADCWNFPLNSLSTSSVSLLCTRKTGETAAEEAEALFVVSFFLSSLSRLRRDVVCQLKKERKKRQKFSPLN